MSAPLDGLMVCDLTVTIPGPYATSLLHRLGARVIKLEPPSGDVTRLTPALHASLNAGKESVTCDLKTDQGRDLARAVASRADVIVEGWRPGVAERLGVGYDQVRAFNPAVVYCSISGFGASGPLRDRAAHDLNYMALAGMTATMFGDHDPLLIDLPMADLAGGTFAALRILAAVLPAKLRGEGAHIDASLAGAVREWVDAIGATEDENPAAGLGQLPHYGVFRTGDGHFITIGTVNEDHFWRALTSVLGIQGYDDLGFMDRWAKAAELRPLIEDAIGSRTRADLEGALTGVDTCWAFVDPPRTEPSIGGRIASATQPPPQMGEHTEQVRAEFAGGTDG